MGDKALVTDMVQRFARLNNEINNIIATERKVRVKYADLDALKQEYLTSQQYLVDKLNLQASRLLEFEVRTTRLEEHCFHKAEPLVSLFNTRLLEHRTEM